MSALTPADLVKVERKKAEQAYRDIYVGSTIGAGFASFFRGWLAAKGMQP